VEFNDEKILQHFFNDKMLNELNQKLQQVVNECAVQINKERLILQAIDRNKQIQQALLSQLTTGLPPSKNKRSLVDLREDKNNGLWM
jgi:TRAP-type mannitol/chloroaromatic compound transport system substrate-binding protein